MEKHLFHNCLLIWSGIETKMSKLVNAYKAGQEAIHLLGGLRTKSSCKCRFCPCLCWYPSRQPEGKLALLLPYHCRGAWPAILESKAVDILKEMILSQFLDAINPPTYKQYTQQKNVMLTHRYLLHVMRALKKEFHFCRWLDVTAWHDVIL